MPWSRLRADRPKQSTNRRRRHSSINLPQSDGLASENFVDYDNGPRPDKSRPSEASPSVPILVDHEQEPNTTQLPEGPPGPSRQDSSLKSQRFSLLKFRHASDSQLSRTARVQAGNPVSQRRAGRLNLLEELLEAYAVQLDG